ncbi:MAG: pyridoxal phosphate-dependent decarboxylase family protein [Bacteroidales bacterium]
MKNDEFRKYAHQMVDWIADYFEDIEKYPVKSGAAPGEIAGNLPIQPPLKGERMDDIFEGFKENIMPGITHWQHPGWFAYFPANSSPPSVLGEFLTAGLGVQGMVWDTSPAATELEEVVMNWLRQMTGLPDNFTGVLQDTASTATLCALISAREKVSHFKTNQIGFHQKLRIYTSNQTHSSIEKGVKIAGFGKENLVYIDTDDHFALIPQKLEEAILRDLDSGYTPCCVVAACGTTSSLAMDPLMETGQICQKYNVWFHIDAAFAGTAAIAPEFRYVLGGAELSDSLVFNPHKWMLTNFDCSAYFVKDPEILKQSFSLMPEYLKTAADEKVNNYRDWGIQLGRRFRALKLWFVISYYGVEGIQQMIREHVRLGQLFASWVEKDDNFEFTAPPNLTLVCFQLVKEGRPEEEINSMNEKLLRMINRQGDIYLTHTKLNGRYTLRMSIAQRNTKQHHVEKAWEIITKAGKTLINQ